MKHVCTYKEEQEGANWYIFLEPLGHIYAHNMISLIDIIYLIVLISQFSSVALY